MGWGMVLASEGTDKALFYGIVIMLWVALLWWGTGYTRGLKSPYVREPKNIVERIQELVGDHPLLSTLVVLVAQGSTFTAIWGDTDSSGGGGGSNCADIDLAACPGYSEPFYDESDFDSDMPSVDDVVVPGYAGDLDCDDIGFEMEMGGSDPHGFDADGDGIGCEPGDYP